VQSSFRVQVSKDYLVFASAHFITFRGHQCESSGGRRCDRETRLCERRTHPHGARASECAEIDPQTARTHGQLKTREME